MQNLIYNKSLSYKKEWEITAVTGITGQSLQLTFVSGQSYWDISQLPTPKNECKGAGYLTVWAQSNVPNASINFRVVRYDYQGQCMGGTEGYSLSTNNDRITSSGYYLSQSRSFIDVYSSQQYQLWITNIFPSDSVWDLYAHPF